MSLWRATWYWRDVARIPMVPAAKCLAVPNGLGRSGLPWRISTRASCAEGRVPFRSASNAARTQLCGIRPKQVFPVARCMACGSSCALAARVYCDTVRHSRTRSTRCLAFSSLLVFASRACCVTAMLLLQCTAGPNAMCNTHHAPCTLHRTPMQHETCQMQHAPRTHAATAAEFGAGRADRGGCASHRKAKPATTQPLLCTHRSTAKRGLEDQRTALRTNARHSAKGTEYASQSARGAQAKLSSCIPLCR